MSYPSNAYEVQDQLRAAVARYRAAFWANARREVEGWIEHERRQQLPDEERERLQDADDRDQEKWERDMALYSEKSLDEMDLLEVTRGAAPANIQKFYDEHAED